MVDSWFYTFCGNILRSNIKLSLIVLYNSTVNPLGLDILWGRLLITASVFLLARDLLWSFLAVDLRIQSCPALCICNSLISSRSYLIFFLILIFKVFPGDIAESDATTHLLSQILFTLLSSLFHLVRLCASPSCQSFFFNQLIC